MRVILDCFFVPEKSLIKQVKRIEKYKKKNGSGRGDMIMQRKSVKAVKIENFLQWPPTSRNFVGENESSGLYICG